MALQQNQARIASWVIEGGMAKPERVLELAKEFKSGDVFGSPADVAVNLNGSPSGINIKGEVDEAINDFDSLSDTKYNVANFQASHPESNKVSVNFSMNVTQRHISVNIQNADDAQAETVFNYIHARFPRAPEPTEQESEQLTLRLASLVREADKTSTYAREAANDSNQISGELERASGNANTTAQHLTDVERMSKEVSEKHEAVKREAAAVSESRVQVSTDESQARGDANEIGALKADIVKFFDEIEGNRKSMASQHKKASEFFDDAQTKTQDIVSRNQKLQEEIREHLQKAVGASLFSAFQQRKDQISTSKWIWAVLTIIGIVAQVGIIVWSAAALGPDDLTQAFYQRPTFLLRAIASIPVVLFIVYAIRQYAREREYEELYSFKAALSFSLSPYLDLVESVSSNEHAEPYRDFVVTTIGQIFDNPIQHDQPLDNLSRKDRNLLKAIIDRLFGLIEKDRK